VKERIINTLRELRTYALTKTGLDVVIFYHEEDSYLMRFANSAISLNTNEHLIRLEIMAHSGSKRASYEMITDLSKMDEMRQGIDIAAEMVVHAQPLSYQPTVPLYTETFIDESAYDEALATISNTERLEYFNRAVAGLETEQIRLSGIFSSGTNILASINTRSEHLIYFCSSDAQISVVLAHLTLKWEAQAEQSAQKKSDLDPDILHSELEFLLDRYQQDPHIRLPLGSYDVVFGPAAIADMLSMMRWIGFSGGAMKRGFSFLSEAQVGQRVFSDKFTLVDDPDNLATFPFKRDLMGIPRARFPLIEQGVFKGFTWFQDDADEFGAQPTGHTVYHTSLVVQPGEQDLSTLEDLAAMPRQKDILYIPFLHYMNIVNPSKGVLTASSRFGALLLKADGTIAVPFNVRLTQSLLDIFGSKVSWLSRASVAYNTSSSYGARNPTAVIVPQFMRVNDLEISHSNPSF
jgi:predicted Zn-dependent protease